MLKRRKELPSYCDGVMEVFREKPRSSSFGAKENVWSVEDMELVSCFAFSEEAKRERDFEFAEQRGFTLSLKVKTHLAKGPDSDCKAVIDGLLYDISHIDKSRTEMFFYLEGGRPVEQRNA